MKHLHLPTEALAPSTPQLGNAKSARGAPFLDRLAKSVPKDADSNV